ncbi:MAG: hypothetical protein JWN56_1930 [Sphingobacteriales bacterium]|nr:hypothetical protein [Sphingobacteriales bacterium]
MKKDIYEFEVAKGFILSNIFAFAIIGITKHFAEKQGVLIFSEFVIVPFVMGVICAWSWKELGMTRGRMTWVSCLNALIGIGLSAIILKEGAICLLIVSPLIFGFMITGAFTGRAMFKKNNQNLNVSILSLLFVLFIADSLSVHQYENLVSDEIVINAPPEKVWKNVVAFEKIKEKNKFWLFQAGMPAPMATTVEGYYKGAGRKCIFSNGYIFDEKIVTYSPNHDLTFDIIGQPKDPEIMGHIDIIRGQFLLKDNGNGTTTVIGNSWYKLYVFPVWYYDIWAKSITRNVHLRVMDHIKALSEKN